MLFKILQFIEKLLSNLALLNTLKLMLINKQVFLIFICYLNYFFIKNFRKQLIYNLALS